MLLSVWSPLVTCSCLCLMQRGAHDLALFLYEASVKDGLLAHEGWPYLVLVVVVLLSGSALYPRDNEAY